jgi:hypothetical protein
VKGKTQQKHATHKTQNAKCKTQNARRKTQNAKRKTQNEKRKTQNAIRKTSTTKGQKAKGKVQTGATTQTHLRIQGNGSSP